MVLSMATNTCRRRLLSPRGCRSEPPSATGVASYSWSRYPLSADRPADCKSREPEKKPPASLVSEFVPRRGGGQCWGSGRLIFRGHEGGWGFVDELAIFLGGEPAADRPFLFGGQRAHSQASRNSDLASFCLRRSFTPGISLRPPANQRVCHPAWPGRSLSFRMSSASRSGEAMASHLVPRSSCLHHRQRWTGLSASRGVIRTGQRELAPRL